MPNFKKAKSSNWIENDQFGDFDACKDEPSAKTPRKTVLGRKRARDNNNTLKKNHTPTKSFSVPELAVDQERGQAPASGSLDPSELWIQRHHPASVEELAVNTKKIGEVRTWLANSVRSGTCYEASVAQHKHVGLTNGTK